jgi:hypothetical protein
VLRINVGEFNPMLGRSYAEIAAQSRSQHKSQAFGSIQPKGVRFTSVRREATRVNESDAPAAETSLFDGIDTTWARFRTSTASPEVTRVVDLIQAKVKEAQGAPYLRDPASAVPPLSELAVALTQLGAAPDSTIPGVTSGSTPTTRLRVSDDLRRTASIAYRRTVNAIALASGVAVEATRERGRRRSDHSARADRDRRQRSAHRYHLQPRPCGGAGGSVLHRPLPAWQRCTGRRHAQRGIARGLE